MKIAVLGAGFCGLAVCWHLLQAKHRVTVFDPSGVGGEASGISAGLLHPFGGLHSKLNWQGREGMAASKELLKVAEQALGKPVANYNGILRPAFTSEQCADFQLCASRFQDVEWLSAAEANTLDPLLPQVPALFISEAVTIDSPLYLEGLWQACAQLGAELILKKISHLDELPDYAKVIACMGAGTHSFAETRHLPLSFVKGQILELEWPTHLPPLPHSINSQVYITLLNGKCLAGSTYERGFTNSQAEGETAAKLLMPRIAELYPALKCAKVLHTRAGIRAVTPNHLPSLIKHNDRLFSLTGMGSKGLLYHGLMAKLLVDTL